MAPTAVPHNEPGYPEPGLDTGLIIGLDYTTKTATTAVLPKPWRQASYSELGARERDEHTPVQTGAGQASSWSWQLGSLRTELI